MLAFDYRRLGRSGSTPRQEIEPAAQIEDWRNAITPAAHLPGIDATRIGIWGTSYAGGHVLVLVSADPADLPVYSAPEAVAWYLRAGAGTGFENRVTLRSLEYARAYEPGAHVAHISPRPLMMIVAEQDHITPTDLALNAFARASEPKALERIKGDRLGAERAAA